MSAMEIMVQSTIPWLSGRMTAKMLAPRHQLAAHVVKRAAWKFERSHPHYYVPPTHKLINTQEEINMIAAKQGKISLTKGYPRGKIYKALEEDQPLEPIRVILLHNTEDFGPRGQIVVVENPKEARRDLLLPGLAVYATDENLEKFKDIIIPEDELVHSSQYIKKILPILARYVIPITVNPYGTWVLEARHVRACMMKLRIEVPEECIEMPLQDIRGPRPSDEHKEFLVHIAINGIERIPVRCVIHYRNAPKVVGWMHTPHEPLLEEQQDELFKSPRNRVGPRALENHGDNVSLPYKKWRQRRDEQLKSETAVK